MVRSFLTLFTDVLIQVKACAIRSVETMKQGDDWQLLSNRSRESSHFKPQLFFRSLKALFFRKISG